MEKLALDNRQSLRLLGAHYSANAYPFSAMYQNCNQWAVEMLAAAHADADDDGDLRVRAQAWLKAQHYEPTVFQAESRPLMWATAFVPWLHRDDHPQADLDQLLFRVSMPVAIEAFLQSTLPEATRVEFCHTEHQVVVRRGWQPLADGCVAGEGDEVIGLD